ncbi:organic cation/carnitine transporter 7-like [Dorcoceras hygrometricum]|uniref:Organic cation/carnitine transporter 7-like n=1 Tax=Dorcoceras hygrometricum TaxID=472368 RepID=A0A2Z7A700_9LAMI|nr:organic cation/carnitine transporter 7-like [Dorcoceras hygrometricum]
MPTLGWRWLLVLSSIPCFGALVFYFLTVESPRYLYMNGRITDAQNILRKMAISNRKDPPSGTLVFDQMAEPDEEFTPSEDAHFLSAGKKDITIYKRGFSSILTLLSPPLLKTTLLLWIVYFGNTFSYYGVVLLTSELSSSRSKCNVTNLHLHKFTDTSIYINEFITSFAEVPGLILAAVIVDKIGRRISMVLMYSFCFIFLLPLTFHQNDLLTTCLLFGARMCIIGAFTVAGIYCPEIYPTSVRSTGFGVSSSVGRIAGMICPLVAVGLVSACHQMSAIILFELSIVLAGFGVLFLPIETKGKELNDIVGNK